MNKLKKSPLIHYTSEEAIKKIFNKNLNKGNYIYLSNLSRVNDSLELKKVKKKNKSYYVLSFANTKIERVAMWMMYGNLDGKYNKNKIAFVIKPTHLKRFIDNIEEIYIVNKNNQITNKKFDVKSNRIKIKYSYVDYCFKKKGKNSYFIGLDKDEKPIFASKKKVDNDFFIKDYCWVYENEFRLLIECSNIKSNKIAIKLPDAFEKKIDIITGPEMSNKEYNQFIKQYKKYFNSISKTEVKFKSGF